MPWKIRSPLEEESGSDEGNAPVGRDESIGVVRKPDGRAKPRSRIARGSRSFFLELGIKLQHLPVVLGEGTHVFGVGFQQGMGKAVPARERSSFTERVACEGTGIGSEIMIPFSHSLLA